TTLDLLAAGARAIVVPFAAGRETEQAMRAALLAGRGAFHLLPEAELSGRSLAAAIAVALAAPSPVMPVLRRDGAAVAAARIAALIASTVAVDDARKSVK